jgi:cytochrome c-type biogenesis protein CcmE
MILPLIQIVFRFIWSKGRECEVILGNSKPQDFERSEEIVATGHIENGKFIAGNILMKCPSKYNNGQTEVNVASR